MVNKHIAIMLFIFCLLTGCKSTKYIPVTSTKVEYRTNTDTLRDSIYHDVFVDRYIKGDTVFVCKTEYLYKDKWRCSVDTLIKTDSIQVPYPVEKALSRWEQWKSDAYLPTAISLFFTVLVVLAFLVIRRGKL